MRQQITRVSWKTCTKKRTKGSCKLLVDAGGEDWRHWKKLLENRFTKETNCLPFSVSDFPQFIITFICCVNRWSRNWFLELILQRLDNFSQWYSRWLCDFTADTASRLNGVKRSSQDLLWFRVHLYEHFRGLLQTYSPPWFVNYFPYFFFFFFNLLDRKSVV